MRVCTVCMFTFIKTVVIRKILKLYRRVLLSGKKIKERMDTDELQLIRITYKQQKTGYTVSRMKENHDRKIKGKPLNEERCKGILRRNHLN